MATTVGEMAADLLSCHTNVARYRQVPIIFENYDHKLFQMLAAPPDISGGALLFATALAQWAIFIGPALLILIWVLGNRLDRRAAVGACLTGLFALAMAGAISSLYLHPRPFMNGDAANFLQHAPDSSFPSDHATVLFALGWFLMIVPPPHLRAAWIVPIVLAGVVGWSRIFLGAHYPIDIAGASLIALISAFLLSSTMGRKLSSMLTAWAERIYEWPLSIFRSGG